jgi:predicted MFS family arabinose efflux permease
VHEPVPLRRNRDFTLLWSGHTVSVLGSQITATAYPLLVLAMTSSATAAGVVGFFAWIPYALFAVPTGWLVDRFDRRRLMILAETGRGLAIGSLVLAFAFDVLTLPQIVLVAFVEGSLFVLFDLAEIPAVRNVVAPDQVPSALALNEARARGALLAARPIGGALFDLSRVAPFVADLVSYAVSTVALLFVRGPLQAERSTPAARLLTEVLAGARWLWRQPFLRLIPALSFGINFLFQGLVLVVIVAARDAGASGTVIGVVLGLVGAGGILGALAAPLARRRIPLNVIIMGAIWFWAVLLLVLALAPPPYGPGGVFAVMAFAGSIWNVASGTYAVAVTPDALLGRMQAAARVVALGGIPFGALVCGLLLDAVGPSATAVALAAAMSVLAFAATASSAVRRPPDVEVA